MMICQTKHTCAICKTLFNAATLSDMSYGEFLLWSASRECRFLDAISDKTYQETIKLIERLKKEYSDTFEFSENLAQLLFGELACDADTKGFPFKISNPPCPNCGSDQMQSVGSEVISKVYVDNVSHRLWSSLSTSEKEQRLLSILNKKSNA